MKKLLLMAALAATLSQAQADDFGQYFKLTYNDQEITNGQTIEFANYYDDIVMNHPEFKDDPEIHPFAEFDCEEYIYFLNLSKSNKKIEYNMTLVEPAQLTEAMGGVAICFGYKWDNAPSGNCNDLSSPDNIQSIPSGGQLELKFEHLTFTDLTPLTYKLDVWVSDGGVKVAEASYTVLFSNKHDISLGVEGIEAADQAARYYNLQGVEVSQPEKGGIYVVRKGGKTTKQKF